VILDTGANVGPRERLRSTRQVRQAAAKSAMDALLAPPALTCSPVRTAGHRSCLRAGVVKDGQESTMSSQGCTGELWLARQATFLGPL
jgi:hypothetical protein